MTLETPGHAVRLGQINRRHVVDGAVATKTTDAAVHVCRMIVIDVINCPINPHPVDRIACFPAGAHRLQLWIVLLHLRMAVHAGLCVRYIGVRRHFHKAVTISAIHPQLCNVNVVRKRHRLDRLISYFCVFWRAVIPRGASQSTREHDAADQELDWHPIRPAWKEICHDYLSADGLTNSRRRAANETKLSSGTFGFRRCKGLRLIVRPRGNGFYKCGAREQNKFRQSCASRIA